MNNLLNKIIDILNQSPISSFVMDNAFVFPALEMAHFLGLCLLFGSLIIVDLRMLGFAKNMPLNLVDKFLKFAIAGFSINFISGALFVIGDSDRYLVNIAFWAKMAVIVVAGLNTLYFLKAIKPLMTSKPTTTQLPTQAHLVAWLSLISWTLVIILGRLIPYVE
ncbi:DUF6644 family protein [Paraglaciecola sp. 2405UD69-4]|uniref:DUF6644 family protein n=1 Tax=Paraglaciecola sp. 2405UD69-4 TaxID=3391836 RepID=UPI0039C96641